MKSMHDYRIAGDTTACSQWILATGQSGAGLLSAKDASLGNLPAVGTAASYLAKGRTPNLNYNLQSIDEPTDSESRPAGFDLDYYKQCIPPEQFRLLMEFLSYSAPGNSDPEEFFYPEDL